MDQPQPDELRFAYDSESDVLYVSIGEPKESVSKVLENGVIVRYKPDTRQVVGLTIIDFSHTFASTHPRPVAPGLKAELIPT